MCHAIGRGSNPTAPRGKNGVKEKGRFLPERNNPLEKKGGKRNFVVPPKTPQKEEWGSDLTLEIERGEEVFLHSSQCSADCDRG